MLVVAARRLAGWLGVAARRWAGCPVRWVRWVRFCGCWVEGRLACCPACRAAPRPVLAWEAAEWVPLAAEERGVPAGRLLAWVERELGC